MNLMNILVVEDEALVAADLSWCLADFGYHVADVVDTGEAAVSQTLALRPDLVLMDIRLKGQLDGIQASGQIRAAVRPPPPVVFMTSHTDEDTLARAGLSEPFGYLVKPYEPRALRAAIEMAYCRNQAELRIRQMEQWLATTLRSIGDGIIAITGSGRVSYINPMGQLLTGWTLFEALGQPWTQVFRAVRSTNRHPIPNPVQHAMEEGKTVVLDDETLLLHRKGQEIPIDNSVAPIRDDEGHVTGAVLVFRDATERRRREAEREQLIAELREALDKVKTLRGLLPICAWCKKIRTDTGYWQSVEDYFRTNTQAKLTHSICPECSEEAASGRPSSPSSCWGLNE